MKLCKDCRWAQHTPKKSILSGPDPYAFVCMHPSALYVHPPDPVLGQNPPPYQLRCLDARDEFPEMCGPEGKFWEPIGFGPPLQPQEKSALLRDTSHLPLAPPLSDEAMRRESIYDGQPRGFEPP